ncbi:AAA family ATPase [Pelagibacterium mangrovi]|uniref:AAA family ATPase n=1 Tax=Pelagibacterium mangrovi TaxID=3119828 RepID=UPI002FC9A71B
MSAIIYLIGYPGVGKLTIARALATMTGARLVDNHLVNNVALSLLPDPNDVSERVWEEIRQIRDAALRIIAWHADPGQSFILTNVMLEAPDDRALLAQVELTASRRGSVFVPVVLDCAVEENMARLTAPGRAENLKETDRETAMRRRRSEPLLGFIHANRLDLDVTRLSPEAAAGRIVAHMEGLHP